MRFYLERIDISIRTIRFGYTFLKVYMSLLFGFSGIELERKIKEYIVSFHNFGGAKHEILFGTD
jgi:hypothetical protein